MTNLVAVPRYGADAILILHCGHSMSVEGDWSDVTHLSPFPFDCRDGCGSQSVTDLVVRHD